MPTIFKHAVNVGIGITPVEVVQIPLEVRATVIGINLVNVTENIVTANVFVATLSTDAYYAKELIIPPNTTLKVITQGEKLILDEQSSLKISSNTNNSIDATVSFVEIT